MPWIHVAEAAMVILAVGMAVHRLLQRRGKARQSGR